MAHYKDKLRPEYGVDHREIASLISEKYSSDRYWTVVSAWRKRLFEECRIDMTAVPGFGFRVLHENERVTEGVRGFGKSMRALRKSGQRIEASDPAKLDDAHRRQRDHGVRMIGELVDAGKRAQRQIKTVAKVEVLPRVKEDSA
jgi:hypothetical protein